MLKSAIRIFIWIWCSLNPRWKIIPEELSDLQDDHSQTWCLISDYYKRVNIYGTYFYHITFKGYEKLKERSLSSETHNILCYLSWFPFAGK